MEIDDKKDVEANSFPSEGFSSPSLSVEDKKGRNDDAALKDKELILNGTRLITEFGEKATAAQKMEEHSKDPTREEHPITSAGPQEQFRAYKTRFWVLGLFSAFGLMQLTLWGTWGPIVESALVAFPDWTPGTASSFSNWAPLVGLFFMFPLSNLVQRFGLRKAMLISCALLALAALLRCFPVNDRIFTVLCHVGALLAGVACCIAVPHVGTVASTWFPPGERTTAVAIFFLVNQLGGLTMYFSPLVVRAPKAGVSPTDILSDIMNLMYIHFGVCFALLTCVWIYFPNLPPSPPSHSAEQERVGFLESIKGLFSRGQLVMLAIAYGLSFGVLGSWIGLMTYSLLEIDIHQEQSMGVAICATLCSSTAAYITGRLTDKIYGHLQVTSLCLLAGSFVAFLWFLFLSTNVITPTLAQVYISVTVGVSLEFASVPLLMELGLEMAYPVSEGVVGASYASSFALVSLTFILLFLIPNIGYLWISYVLLLSIFLSIIPLAFVKEEHNRRQADQELL